MPDIISPFDRPLTHKSFFNIVYFTLISQDDENDQNDDSSLKGSAKGSVKRRGPPVPIMRLLQAAEEEGGDAAAEEDEDDGALKLNTPQEKARYETAQMLCTIFSESGWDVRLVMHALKLFKDDGDMATEWLYGEQGGEARAQMSAIAEQSERKKKNLSTFWTILFHLLI